MIKIILILLVAIVPFSIGMVVGAAVILKAYRAGELMLSTKNPENESLKFAFNENPLNYISRQYVLFKVIDVDKETTVSPK